MSRFGWKTAGAIAASLLVAELFVEFIWAEPAGGQQRIAGELEWDWAPTPSDGCVEFDECFFLKIKDSVECPENIRLELMFSDKNDKYLYSYDAVIKSPRSEKPAVIELDSGDESVFYQYVGLVTCISSPLSALDEL